VRAACLSGDGASLLQILGAMVIPERRLDGARELAARFGADHLTIFVLDREVGVLLPALGFPQTLPEGTRWHRFLAECGRGRLRGELPSPHHSGRVVPALGLGAADGSVIVFVGGAPRVENGEDGELQALLPLVSAALHNERLALAADGRSRVERESGRHLGALAEALDRARLELQRALAEQRSLLDAKLRAIEARDQILAVVSHDVRGPLGTILLSATALRKIATPEAARPRLHSRIDLIVRSADRIQRLVRDLLDFGSIEAGRLGMELRRHDPADLLREAMTSHEPIALQRGLTLDGALDGEPSPLTCDRDRVLQVLSNLVGNAINVTPAGGSVRLRIEPAARDLLFTVADTGPGIDPQDLAHLFERHFRSRHATYRGTGLGLAIAKGIVEAHGGRIWAESRVGAGSSFFFTLPLEPRAGALDDEPRPSRDQSLLGS
jgi:signal transduction histidine kinase